VFLFFKKSEVGGTFCEALLRFESLSQRVPGFLLILIVPQSYYLSLSYLSPSAAVEADLTQCVYF